MKTRLALTLLGIALLAVPASYGQATSGIVGFSNVTVAPGGAVIVPSLVNSSVFQGEATISGTTITPTTAPGWTSGSFNATAFTTISQIPNYPTHYVEIISGTNEGLILDISTNSTTSLTTSQVGPSGTFQVAIREHVTLSKVTQGATGLTEFDDVATLFETVFSPTTQTNRVNRVYVGAPNVWETDTGKPAGHTVIYPGTGFAFTATGTVVFAMMGEVKPTKTQIPLYSTSPNIVAPLNPATNNLLSASGLAATLEDFDDTITTFSTNGLMSALPYIANGGLIERDNGSPVSASDYIALNRGVAIGVLTPKTWIVNSPLNP